MATNWLADFFAMSILSNFKTLKELSNLGNQLAYKFLCHFYML